jgi:hypothetical protein
MMKIEIYSHADEVARQAAKLIAKEARDAVATRGEFCHLQFLPPHSVPFRVSHLWGSVQTARNAQEISDFRVSRSQSSLTLVNNIGLKESNN